MAAINMARVKMAAARMEQEFTAKPADNPFRPFPEYSPDEPGFDITIPKPPPLFRYDGEFKASVVAKIVRASSEDENGSPGNPADVYVVNLNGQKRLLKIYYPPRDEWDMDLFRKEADAYASLMFHKVDETGVIPRCFGMLEFTEPTEFTRSINLKTSIENPPKGIIMEYIEDAKKLNVLDLTKDVADKVVECLLKVHDAYVVHRDVYPRNILVTPDRLVLIDFDRASTYHTPTYPSLAVTPSSLQREKCLCWSYFNNFVVKESAMIFE
ncbi:hypothetical protein RUND412_004466 [Rhizina undulata]